MRHINFSGGPNWGVLGGGQKVYVEKVYVFIQSPMVGLLFSNESSDVFLSGSLFWRTTRPARSSEHNQRRRPWNGMWYGHERGSRSHELASRCSLVERDCGSCCLLRHLCVEHKTFCSWQKRGDNTTINKLKTTPTPNKNGSYDIKGGVCHKSREFVCHKSRFVHHILCANPFISRDLHAMRPLILWHILGACFFANVVAGGCRNCLQTSDSMAEAQMFKCPPLSPRVSLQ